MTAWALRTTRLLRRLRFLAATWGIRGTVAAFWEQGLKTGFFFVSFGTTEVVP